MPLPTPKLLHISPQSLDIAFTAHLGKCSYSTVSVIYRYIMYTSFIQFIIFYYALYSIGNQVYQWNRKQRSRIISKIMINDLHCVIFQFWRKKMAWKISWPSTLIFSFFLFSEPDTYCRIFPYMIVSMGSKCCFSAD